MNKGHLFVFCLLIFGTACNRVGADDLKKYVNDESNGLVSNVVSPGAKYVLHYHPHDLAFAYEMRGNTYGKKDYEAYMDANKNITLFILDVELDEATKDKTSDFSPIKHAYQSTLNTAFFSLSENNVSYPCVLYHCETQGQGRYKINLGFEIKSQEITENITVIFKDPVTGYAPEFHFKKTDIERIPRLKI